MIISVLATVMLSCVSPVAATSPDAALNCLTLYPTPDLAGVSGTVALLPVPSPFGVAVTVDGRTRYHLSAAISGLPEPQSLGNYSVYVAWAYTLALDSVVKLGPVHNGNVDLGELHLMQFRILVS